MLVGLALLGAGLPVREFDVVIRNRHVEQSMSTIRVERGQTVVLRLKTDEAVSLHLHGYDLTANVSPAVPATLRFDATVAGRFPIAAHGFGAATGRDDSTGKHREVTLLYLEVLP